MDSGACIVMTSIGTEDEAEALAEAIVEARYAAIEAFIRERHSYQTPEIIRVPVSAGAADYLTWLRAGSSPPAQL